MCLIAFAWRVQADYPLVVVANRDEFYNRPTQRAHFWKDQPQIFGGRDLSAGGSWMAVSRNGRFAALTNYRDPHNLNAHAPSRGSLVSDFLISDLSATDYANSIRQQAIAYNGFNLIICDGDRMVYYSNQIDDIRILEPGTYALSNALLDTPWPKTLSACKKLSNWLEQPGKIDSLIPLLIDSQTVDDEQLPDTGIPQAMEKALSAQFIKLDHYGTRCTTAVIVDKRGDAEFIEQLHHPDAGQTFQRLEAFW
jgi:uncharacterized protein with NRDE domain